jgi:hypothetical protein
MSTGPIALACLLLTVHQGLPEEMHLNFRDFKIPIVLSAGKQTDIRQLFLYFSDDEGQTWQTWREASPNEKSFIFRAPRDGKYWFIVGQEDHQGNKIPADPMRVRPNQRIVVDTMPPRVQVAKAERQPNGDVLLQWTIAEDYPDPQSLRLSFHTPSLPPDKWTPLPVDPQSSSSEKQFNPGSPGEVRVRVQIKDRAGNPGQAETVVSAPGGSVPAPVPAFNVIPTNRSDAPAQPGLLASRQTPYPPNDQPPPSPPNPPRHEDTFQPLTSPTPMNPPEQPPLGPSPVATSSALAATPATFAPEAARGALPPVQIVNKREVRIEFEVAKFGPSGLGGADVYVTLNEGATWERWPREVPVTLPPLTESHGSVPVRGSVMVQLEREAITYGFIVAVKSKAGRARPAPKPGEPPRIRVELDATVPKAEMYEPRPDPRQPDTLILTWNAVDRHLPGEPVSLEWAERKEGPWSSIGGEHLPNTIAAGLPPMDRVTGACSWRLPERMPDRVYLRLTVQDQAGNRAVAETANPVLIDLSVPETNIIGVAPGVR